MNQKILSRCVLLALSGLSAMTYAQETAVNTTENASSQSDSAITARSATPPPQQSIELQPITILGGEINGVDSTLPNVDVINVYTLRNPSATNLREALSDNPSVEIQRRNGAGQLYIRGMGNNYVELTLDGEKLPDLYLYGPYVSGGRDFIDTNTLRQIDIVKGLQSPKQTTSALAGTVNLQTYVPSDFVDESHPFYTDIGIDYTSKDSGIGGTATVAGTQGNYSGLLILTHRNYHEMKNMGKDSDKTLSQNKEDNKQNNVLLKGEMAAEKGKLFLTGEYFNRAQSITARYPGGPVKPYDQPTSRKRLGIEGKFNDIAGLDTVNAKLYGQGYNQTTESYSMTDSIGREHYNQAGVAFSVDATKKLSLSSLSNQFLFGLGYGWNKYEQSIDKPYRQFTPAMQPVDAMRFFPLTHVHNLFAYAKDNITLTDSIVLSPGLRIEYNKISPVNDQLYKNNPAILDKNKIVIQSNKVTVSPSIHASFAFSQYTKVYASYARGGRSADMLNLSSYDHGFAFILPNPDLKSETSNNFELGMNYQIPESLELKVSAFFSKYDNFITTQRDGYTIDPITHKQKPISRRYNLDNYQTYGFELESGFAMGEQLYAHFALGWMQGSLGNQASHGVALNQAYPAKAVLGLKYKQGNSYGGDLKVTIAGQGQKPEDNPRTKPFRTPSYTLVDLTAWWKPINNLTVTGGVYNLTNKKYWPTDVNGQATIARSGPVNMDTFTQPGRNFAVSMKYSY